ncbi:polymerase [Vibrio phage J14]|nr:polymerase [Vibrio phage J14]
MITPTEGDDWRGGNGTTSPTKDPAIQTLPKKTALAKRLRSCYEPPEGYSIVEIDFSQGEVRGWCGYG